MAYELILYEVSDKVATITLNRPDRMNAWTPTMERDVRHAMEASSADDDVRVIVLTGAGRAFCAGADMDALKGLDRRANELGARVTVIGPAPAYIARRADRWRWNVVLRGDDPATLLEGGLEPPWSVDVDPESLL